MIVHQSVEEIKWLINLHKKHKSKHIVNRLKVLLEYKQNNKIGFDELKNKFHKHKRYFYKVKKCYNDHGITGLVEMKTKKLDLVGHRYGRLIVLNMEPGLDHKDSQWNCRCDCGKTVIVSRKRLRDTAYPMDSCGCRIDEKKAIARKARETRLKLIKNQLMINSIKTPEIIDNEQDVWFESIKRAQRRKQLIKLSQYH